VALALALAVAVAEAPPLADALAPGLRATVLAGPSSNVASQKMPARATRVATTRKTLLTKFPSASSQQRGS